MLRVFLSLLLILSFTSFVSASPFVVANLPDASEQVQGYNVYLDGIMIIQTQGVTLSASGAAIVFDIAEQQDALPFGSTYNLEVTAWNAAGESAPAPFILVLPANAPVSPLNIQLEQ